ncbi:hypothetical protein CHS0354_026659 [Potamilus streckersoni]|uniref:Uncharacterized protein n=1 Tax=Potamilus streckersoni TaxID=2493646 RepID=A0AAE0VQK3_9BIVA|nr:hypothetical protein CHS0354_026659 [Potamilus streckersoni]
MAEYDYQMSFPRRRDNGPECLNTISSGKKREENMPDFLNTLPSGPKFKERLWSEGTLTSKRHLKKRQQCSVNALSMRARKGWTRVSKSTFKRAIRYGQTLVITFLSIRKRRIRRICTTI